MSEGEKTEQLDQYPPIIIAALIEIARAAWQLADNTEERDNEQFVCDSGDFAKLGSALDILEQLPEPLGEVATGPRKAEYWLELGRPIQTIPAPTMTAPTMTTENQIAIAEACGWKVEQKDQEYPFVLYDPNGNVFEIWKTLDHAWSHGPFFNSLDSMQQAVLAQDEEFQRVFARKLADSCHNKGKTFLQTFHQLTVTDWQESFVETLKELGSSALIR